MENQTVSEHIENSHDETPQGMPGIEIPDIKNSMNERYGSRSGHYNLRPRHERNINRWNDTVLSCYGIDDPSVMVSCTPNIISIKA